MSEIVIVFAIIAVVVALFIWDRLPVVVVCLGCALALWASGVLTLNQAMAGFGDPATIFIAALFVVGGGLEATGVTAWAGQKLTEAAGESRTRLIVAMMALVAVLTALIGPTGAVAALMSVVVVLAVRLGREPAKLLLPLAFHAPGEAAPTQGLLERIAVRLAGLERPYTRRDMLQGRLPIKKSIVN